MLSIVFQQLRYIIFIFKAKKEPFASLHDFFLCIYSTNIFIYNIIVMQIYVLEQFHIEISYFFYHDNALKLT